MKLLARTNNIEMIFSVHIEHNWGFCKIVQKKSCLVMGMVNLIVFCLSGFFHGLQSWNSFYLKTFFPVFILLFKMWVGVGRA